MVFKQVSGTPVIVGSLKIDPGDTLVFREDASNQITFAFITIQNAALKKLAWYESGGAQLGTLGILLLVFLSAVIIS